MRRREFINLLGGAAAWSGTARAQHPKIFLLGYLDPGLALDAAVQNLRRQFLLGLRDLGDLEGRNFQMEDRNADGHLERLPALAADLVRLPVDILIATGGEASVRAAMQATDKIPIVMTVGADPIGGLVASLARPGGNVTGMSALASEMGSKRVELLKDIIPRASRVVVMWNPDNKSKVTEFTDTQKAAKLTGLSLISVEVRAPEEIEGAFSSILRERPDAMITLTEALTLANRERIGRFALSNRVPMFAELREFAVAGGLASYGASRPDLWRRSATYVHKIMRGAMPADLPVEQPVKFEMVINLKTAQALGIDVPLHLEQLADEVIE
jgi:putative tryptophan/tyrosine transport system substrate-binding protein